VRFNTLTVGKKVSRQVAEMVVRHMVLQGFLVEDAYFTGPYGSVAVKVKVLLSFWRNSSDGIPARIPGKGVGNGNCETHHRC
jgi:hypothetical protein